MKPFTIYIGYDARLPRAWDVAARSAEKYGAEVIKLQESILRVQGILTRPMDRRDGMYDFNSGAPQSTEFAIARFAVPFLAHVGTALFVDSDVVFLQNPEQLLSWYDPSKAVMVVKHTLTGMEETGTKMDGQVQLPYQRKNWSSVVVWNLDHPANRRLNLMALNQWPGRDLHAFRWLADDEIGELPPEANWLVGVQPKPVQPIIAHFTLGTPDMPGYEKCDHSELWYAEEKAA